MTCKAVKVDRTTNEVTVVSSAATLPLKIQELRTAEADDAAIKQAPKLGLSRAGIADSRTAHRHPTTKAVVEDPRRFHAIAANADIVLEPIRIYKLR